MAKRKIAVGIDFSEYSDVALEQATWLAGHTGAELILVHVTAPPLTYTGPVLASAQVWQKLIKQRSTDDGLKARDMANMATSQGVPTTHQIALGDPAEQLAIVADSTGAELVAVGTHGLTGALAFLLGSAAQGVVRQARCNVLVARSSVNWATGPKRILVATDFTNYADEALRAAIELAPDDATIDIVHCWEALAAYGTGAASLANLTKDLQTNAEELGKALVAEFATDRLHLRFEAVPGSAGATVIDHAKQEPGRYHLIVTGSHGRRGFRRFFLGSVAENIVRHAPCSVLVVQGPTEDQARR